jgi:hypothetical protein
MNERLAVNTMSLELGQPGAHAGALMNSTEELVARVRAGDEEAFRLIFDRYSRPVLSFIFDMVGDRAQAEDLAQETFVRAYRGLSGLREETKLSTWLFAIAKNNGTVDWLAGHPFLRNAVVSLPSFLQPAPDQHSFVLGYDEKGTLVYDLQGSGESAYVPIASATEHDGILYLGSVSRGGVARIAAPAPAQPEAGSRLPRE